MDIRDTEQYKAYLRTDKWKAIAKRRIEIDNHTCVMCKSRGTMTNCLEVHHLSYRYLYHEENRIYEDLVTLCHSCHKSVHNLMCRITSPSGRRGWKDSYYVPQISVYTLTGETMENREVNGNE